MKRFSYILLALAFFMASANANAQALTPDSTAAKPAEKAGEMTGRVFNALNNQPLGFATVQLAGTEYGTQTDDRGTFVISGIPPGLYNVKVSLVGFAEKVINEIQVSSAPTGAN